MKTFDQKLERATSELAQKGMLTNSAYPPLLKMLNKAGLKTRPPHYAPFIIAFNVTALLFACIWGGAMWLFIWSPGDMPPNRALSTAILGGACFGLAMALYYAHGRKKHGLTPWDQL